MFGSKKNALRNARPRRRMLAESLESRRLLTSSMGWDGPGLGSAQLTYHVSNAPAGLSQAETDAAIEAALDAWSSVVDIDFTQTDQAGQIDSLDISFARLDGPGGTLAQAYFPDDVNPARVAGDIQFDTSESWEVGNAAGRSAFDLVYVAVHEIGHALGLDHSDATSSILAPTVSPNQSFSTLDQDDIQEIQSLYARRISTEVAGNSPSNEFTPLPFGPVQPSATDLPTDQNDDSQEPRVWEWFRTTVVVTKFQTNRQPFHWKINWSTSPDTAINSFRVNTNHLFNRFLAFDTLDTRSPNSAREATSDDSPVTQGEPNSLYDSTPQSGHSQWTGRFSGFAGHSMRILRLFRG